VEKARKPLHHVADADGRPPHLRLSRVRPAMNGARPVCAGNRALAGQVSGLGGCHKPPPVPPNAPHPPVPKPLEMPWGCNGFMSKEIQAHAELYRERPGRPLKKTKMGHLGRGSWMFKQRAPWKYLARPPCGKPPARKCRSGSASFRTKLSTAPPSHPNDARGAGDAQRSAALLAAVGAGDLGKNTVQIQPRPPAQIARKETSISLALRAPLALVAPGPPRRVSRGVSLRKPLNGPGKSGARGGGFRDNCRRTWDLLLRSSSAADKLVSKGKKKMAPTKNLLKTRQTWLRKLTENLGIIGQLGP